MDPEAPNLFKQAWQIYFEEATAIQKTKDDKKCPIKANLGTEGKEYGFNIQISTEGIQAKDGESSQPK